MEHLLAFFAECVCVCVSPVLSHRGDNEIPVLVCRSKRLRWVFVSGHVQFANSQQSNREMQFSEEKSISSGAHALRDRGIDTGIETNNVPVFVSASAVVRCRCNSPPLSTTSFPNLCRCCCSNRSRPFSQNTVALLLHLAFLVSGQSNGVIALHVSVGKCVLRRRY